MQTDIEFYQDAVDFWAKEVKYDEQATQAAAQALLDAIAQLDAAKSRLRDGQGKLSYWQDKLAAVSQLAVYPPPNEVPQCQTNTTKF